MMLLPSVPQGVNAFCVLASPVAFRGVCATFAFAMVFFAGSPLRAADKLVGRAVLPAATFAPGPTSGSNLGATMINGQSLPFVNKQPVQGFSAVLDNHDGTFNVMCDNGYGSIENSADFKHFYNAVNS